MGQWGKVKTVNGVRICPYILTKRLFVPAEPNDVINELYIIGIDPDYLGTSEETINTLKEKYVNKPFSTWEEKNGD